MTRTNHSSDGKPSQRKATSRPAAARSVTQADVRRNTYTPGRPAGLHARELGFKKR